MVRQTGETPFRRRVDLDGRWEFVTDPDRTGRDAGWHEADAEWPDRARTVEVPHAWQELDAYRDYAGTAWYRRAVDVPEGVLDDRDALLRFGAVDYETTVWVNGRRVGYNRGGYLPFELDATDALTAGENAVVLRVDDPEDLSEVPHGKQGDPWYTRVSGPWQPVAVAFRPRTRVVTARVVPDLAADVATVELEVERGPPPIEELDSTVASAKGQVPEDVPVGSLTCTVRALRDGDVAATTEADLDDDATDGDRDAEVVLQFDDPAYWSPEDPALYDLEVLLRRGGVTVDRYADTFGFRSFETDGDRFLLNGEPIAIRGVLDQGYYPGTLYRPPGEEAFARGVETAKELGFNLVRKHVKPAHPAFLEAADRRGILVWEEPANPTRDTERSRAELLEQLHGMVERDYNRPSVVVWSLYNEEWGLGHEEGEPSLWTDEEKQRFLADQYQALRERDLTRVVCDNSGWAHVATDVNDFHRYFPSPDRATAMERDLDHVCHYPGDNFATTAFDDPDAPIVVSEFGTWGFPDVAALRERDGGEPHWFAHEFLAGMKRPAGVEERFVRTDLPAAFDDLDDLAAAWQRREFVSVEHAIEQLRIREPVAGYVLTQLSDVEWEFNGLLGYGREQKAFHDDFARVNAPVAVVATPSTHVAWAGDAVDLAVAVVNDTGRSLAGTVEWELGDQRGTATATVPARAVERVDVGTIATAGVVADGAGGRGASAGEVGPVGAGRTRTLTVTFSGDGRSATTSKPVTVLDPAAREVPSGPVYAERAFGSRLAGAGVEVTHETPGDVDVAVTDRMTGELDRFASWGGAVVHVPGDDGRMTGGGPFSYRALPDGESWIGAASFLYQHSPLLADVCDGPRLGWEFEGLYPRALATDLDPGSDEVHVGYVEGWLADWGSPLVTRPYGDGSVTALTFRAPEAYGTDPTATLLVDRLLASLADDA